jgi:uracil-DNA glycosylase family 4
MTASPAVGSIPGSTIRRVSALVDLEREASACTRCPLAEGRTNVVFGVGDPRADLMFVGEGPGRDEDLKGEPFVGRSGQLLDRVLVEELGIGRDRVYIANVVKCRPPGNRDPHPAEVASCRPYLERQIELIEPRVIVTLGNFATRLLLDADQGIKQLRGRAYPYGTAMIVPTFHPSFVLRSGAMGAAMAGFRADLVRAKQHLGARLSGSGA